MEKIPTAEEFLNKYKFKSGEHIGNSDYDLMAQYAVEFAKLHVRAALEAAAENAKAFHQYPWTHNDPYVDVHSVISAYPESNIV
jgi:hypothetical protein